MAYGTRINYTAELRVETWDRWKRGESLDAIGKAFDQRLLTEATICYNVQSILALQFILVF